MSGPSFIREVAPDDDGGSRRSDPKSDDGSALPNSWWGRYVAAGLGGLTETARRVVELDSKLIAEEIAHDLTPGGAWPDERVRRGIVVGAVQSGKTASMFGVAANLLDAGIDILIILAGTRVALWRQTFERLLAQLDDTTPETARRRRHERLLVPSPSVLMDGAERSTPTTYMQAAAGKFERALGDGKPAVLVIPKHQAHLLAASRFFEARVPAVIQTTGRSLHMVILDDEADDGSVLDATQDKITPQRIEMLWSSRTPGSTFHERLYATYVAYTATPQANFLQDSFNPLSPRDFCCALRVPWKDGGQPDLRLGPTYTEPRGLSAYYCGGEMYYRAMPSGPGALAFATDFPEPRPDEQPEAFAQRTRESVDALLTAGLRSYLVAGALRALGDRSRGRLSVREVRASLTLVEKDMARLPSPHCMLVHPSALQRVQAEEARRLQVLAGGLTPDASEPGSETEAPGCLDVDLIRASIEQSPEAWRACLAAFRASYEGLLGYPGGSSLDDPSETSWEEVQRVLLEEVAPYVRVKIINSDENSDDRPEFHPVATADGGLRAPEDIYTIFVSGSVMSRGITIEGLCTTVFTRPASEPVADTQMQMQRWFGYRGSYIHLCRLYCFADQLDLFRAYHRHDMAMRNEILTAGRTGEVGVYPLLLQGPRALATSKVPTRRLPLHPGPTPSVLLVESGDPGLARGNADLLADILDSCPSTELVVEGTTVGRILTVPWGLLDVAATLEGFRFERHAPDGHSELYARWSHLEDQLDLTAEERPLLRLPAAPATPPAVNVRGCPYSIAAYLRTWKAALQRRRCDGLFPSDQPDVDWALAWPRLSEPAFYVGVRHGSSGTSGWERLAKHGVRRMQRARLPGASHLLATLWGSRGIGGPYLGDQRFDYHLTKFSPPLLHGAGAPWRPAGHPGLLLFHVVASETGEPDAVTVGLCLPHGGPDHFAALPGASS